MNKYHNKFSIRSLSLKHYLYISGFVYYIMKKYKYSTNHLHVSGLVSRYTLGKKINQILKSHKNGKVQNSRA